MATPPTNPSSTISYQGEQIDPSELKPGDHIYAHRYILWDAPLTRYQHHGIYVGKNSNGEHMVVDFKADSSLKRKTLEKFCNSSSLFRVNYNASLLECISRAAGSVQMQGSLPAVEVLKNVEYYEKNFCEWGKYKGLTNNCEQFCVFCKTGKRVNGLKDQGQVLSAIIQGLLAMGVTVFTLKQWAVTAPYADEFVSIICEAFEEYEKLQKEDKDKKDESETDQDKKDESETDQDKKDESEADKDKKDESEEDKDKKDEEMGLDEVVKNLFFLAIQTMIEKYKTK